MDGQLAMRWPGAYFRTASLRLSGLYGATDCFAPVFSHAGTTHFPAFPSPGAGFEAHHCSRRAQLV